LLCFQVMPKPQSKSKRLSFIFAMYRIETIEPDYSRYVNDFAEVDAFATQTVAAPVPARADVRVAISSGSNP